MPPTYLIKKFDKMPVPNMEYVYQN